MIYIKNQINKLVIPKAYAFKVPTINRSWRLFFYSTERNKNYILNNPPNVSPYPNSFLLFDIDDATFNLPIGVYWLKVIEFDNFKAINITYKELVCKCVSANQIVNEYNSEKEYVSYGN